ncbi:IS3 family transposase [Salinivibrio sp. IB643]|uniref:IS3 family transposase n=1 Tax=Salinivibrio sp. IB643 TaxID=1909445 RepID=UPI000D52E971
MIEHGHSQISLVRQCELLSVYYISRAQCQEDLDLMYLIDKQHLNTPYYGSRKMRVHLERQGYRIKRKRVQRLMRTIGIQAVYPRPRTSIPGDGHKIYPYLLNGLKIDRPNQVWATTSAISHWPRASCTLSPLSTGIAVKYCPGGSPTP